MKQIMFPVLRHRFGEITRAESKVPCTRVRYVSDLGYVSKTQTHYTPSCDSHCKTLPLLFRKGQFCEVEVQTQIFVNFSTFKTSFGKMCNFSTKGLSNNFRAFLYENSIWRQNFQLQEREGTFPHYLPLCGRPCVQDDTLRVWVP